MPTREYQIPEIGQVKIHKRKNSRSIRLSLAHEGYVRVSLPYWTPYSAGLAFVKSKKQWIIDNISPRISYIQDNQVLGKQHIIRFTPVKNNRFSSKINNNLVQINHPRQFDIYDQNVQEYASKIATKALQKECEELITPRIIELSKTHDYKYKTVAYKRLKSRWGSCSSHKLITINIFLVQLPWELIDYVLIHELTHTKHMHHGVNFWKQLAINVPNYKELKKSLKQNKPVLINTSVVA